MHFPRNSFRRSKRCTEVSAADARFPSRIRLNLESSWFSPLSAASLGIVHLQRCCLSTAVLVFGKSNSQVCFRLVFLTASKTNCLLFSCCISTCFGEHKLSGFFQRASFAASKQSCTLLPRLFGSRMEILTLGLVPITLSSAYKPACLLLGCFSSFFFGAKYQLFDFSISVLSGPSMHTCQLLHCSLAVFLFNTLRAKLLDTAFFVAACWVLGTHPFFFLAAFVCYLMGSWVPTLAICFFSNWVFSLSVSFSLGSVCSDSTVSIVGMVDNSDNVTLAASFFFSKSTFTFALPPPSPGDLFQY